MPLTAKQQTWIDTNYPKGEEIEIDDNLCECALWTVGERRCSCGNRRIYLETDTCGEDFFAYPQAG